MKITKEGWAVLEDDTHFSKWIEETGEIDHGQRHASMWQNILPKGGVAIDIGANLGDTTIPMGRLVGPTGTVFAFEPNLEAFQCLKHNISNARLDGIILPYPVGASDNNQDRVPFRRNDNVGASHVITDNTEATGYIQLRRLDGHLLLTQLSRLDFVKIDVEGMEIFALKGMVEIIKLFRPIIQLELSGHSQRYGYDKKGVIAEMALLGYAPEIPIAEILNTTQLDVIFRPLAFSDLTISQNDALNKDASNNAKTEEREGESQHSRRSQGEGHDGGERKEASPAPASGGARVQADGQPKGTNEESCHREVNKPNPENE